MVVLWNLDVSFLMMWYRELRGKEEVKNKSFSSGRFRPDSHHFGDGAFIDGGSCHAVTFNAGGEGGITRSLSE